jgi:Inorganic H+ pyrophosphatase
MRLAGAARGVSYVTAIVTAYALFVVLVQDSSLIPSPRLLGGTPTSDPLKQISDADEVDLMDVYVAASSLAGLIVPYVIGALTLLSVSRTSMEMNSVVRTQQVPEKGRELILSSLSPFVEAIGPAFVSILCPLIVGFGLGQRALVGMTLAAIVSGFTLAIMISNTAEAWSSARILIDNGTLGEKRGQGSSWARANVAAERFGNPLKETAGPAVKNLMKLVPSFGIIAIPIMQVGAIRGWIGAILLAACLLVAGGISVARERKAGREREQATTGERRKFELSKLLGGVGSLSPFFEPGPGLPTTRLAPGSQLLREHNALTMSGEEQQGALSLPSYSEVALAPHT